MFIWLHTQQMTTLANKSILNKMGLGSLLSAGNSLTVYSLIIQPITTHVLAFVLKPRLSFSTQPLYNVGLTPQTWCDIPKNIADVETLIFQHFNIENHVFYVLLGIKSGFMRFANHCILLLFTFYTASRHICRASTSCWRQLMDALYLSQTRFAMNT